jgi:anti-anti-sigma factor
MKICHEFKDQCLVVSVTGTLAIDGIIAVRTYLEPLTKTEGLQVVLLELSGLEFIDSGGVGLVTSLHVTLQKSKIALGLVGLNEVVGNIFEMCGLGSVLGIFPDEEAARAKFLS